MCRKIWGYPISFRPVRARASVTWSENSKPEPDIVVAALGKIGLEPEEVLLIGDTPYDIAAAKKAELE